MFQGIAARILVGALAALGSLRLGTGLYFWRVTEALERPRYTVVETLAHGVEIRRYDAYLIAETEVDGVGLREPARDGFRACAGYIFGKNKPRSPSWFSSLSGAPPRSMEPEKMAMTAPVRVSGEVPAHLKSAQGDAITIGTSKKTKVSFVIGNKYSLQTVPQPIDRNVKIRQVAAHTLAVRTFSGPPPKDERVQKERQTIEQALLQSGKRVPGAEEQVLVYGYHDPFITPRFLRRNEVALVIEGAA